VSRGQLCVHALPIDVPPLLGVDPPPLPLLVEEEEKKKEGRGGGSLSASLLPLPVPRDIISNLMDSSLVARFH